jgi:hypothetical protein
MDADSADCGQAFHLKADRDSSRSQTAIRGEFNWSAQRTNLWQSGRCRRIGSVSSMAKDQYGRVARGGVAGDGALPVGQTGGEGADARRAVRDDGLASQACALRQETVGPGGVEAPRERRRRYGATIKDAPTALWEASDRVCGKRLKVMIPTLLPGASKAHRARRDEEHCRSLLFLATEFRFVAPLCRPRDDDSLRK